ncbi:hypothetical protein V3C99_016962 [Haemonchus contortus]
MKVAHKSVSGISTGIMRKSNSKEFDTNVKKVHSLVTEFKAYKPPPGMSESMARTMENIIRRIFTSTAQTSYEKLLKFEEMRELCLRSRELFLLEPCFVEVAPPLLILGDVHGQLYDMLDILSFIGHPPQKRLLFLGDYVDRGDYSLETITLLLAFKLRFPKEIYLLRGNHETRCVNRQYGFFDECKRKFPEKGVELWTLFQHVFNCLPMAALVGTKIFCAHGGISEDLISFKQFERIVQAYDFRVFRPTDICDIGLLCDLIWADPSPACSLFEESPRGVSFVFGKQAVNDFCNRMNVDLICRAHQCVMEGYEFFADQKCLTLFSAPCYCGELDNRAAVMHVSGQLECRVLTFKKDTGLSTAECKRTIESVAVSPSGHKGAARSEIKSSPPGSARNDVKIDRTPRSEPLVAAPAPTKGAGNLNATAQCADGKRAPAGRKSFVIQQPCTDNSQGSGKKSMVMTARPAEIQIPASKTSSVVSLDTDRSRAGSSNIPLVVSPCADERSSAPSPKQFVVMAPGPERKGSSAGKKSLVMSLRMDSNRASTGKDSILMIRSTNGNQTTPLKKPNEMTPGAGQRIPAEKSPSK